MPDTPTAIRLPADPCTPITAEAADGARISVCAHGGQLLGWRPAGPDGREQLWLSPLARCGPGAAIRGGVPVVFPQFAGRGPLPKHGFARDRTWTLEPGAAGSGEVTATLTDTEATRAAWPHRFTLTLRLAASADRLELVLSVRNDALEGPFTFTAALHAYLAAQARSLLYGMNGARGEDNAADLAPLTLEEGPLAAMTERDLALRDLDAAVRLVHDDGRSVTMLRDGFADLVLWHPGPEHGLADAPVGRLGFVCLEPAQLTPVHLEPAATWQAGAVLVAAAG